MDEPDPERLFASLTLLVAVCEQVTPELEQLEPRPLPLLHRLQETHDLAVDLAATLSESPRRAGAYARQPPSIARAQQ